MTDFGDLQQIELPTGAALYYRDSDHSYWSQAKQRPDGSWGGSGRIPGVTTATKPLDYRPDNLMRWAAKLNGEGVATLSSEGLSLEEPDDIRTALSFLTSADSIWSALEEAELTYENLRDRRAREGTAIHEKVLYALATGGRVPNLSRLSPAERGYGQAMLAAWRDLSPEPLQVEQVVYSQINSFAGRLDLRAKVGAETWLLDAKTSGFISLAAHAQVQGYEIACQECGFGASDRQLLLRLADDGNYDLIDSQASAADFLAALDLYERAKRISAADRKARKERETEAVALTIDYPPDTLLSGPWKRKDLAEQSAAAFRRRGVKVVIVPRGKSFVVVAP